MEISFDEAKRLKTLSERQIDFADAWKIFKGPHFDIEDDRFDYGETRFQTFGLIDDRLMMIAWTPTNVGIRIISMRKCNEREQKAFASRLG